MTRKTLFKKRLDIYHEQTKLLLDYYQILSENETRPNFKKILGSGKVSEISRQILAVIQPENSTQFNYAKY